MDQLPIRPELLTLPGGVAEHPAAEAELPAEAAFVAAGLEAALRIRAPRVHASTPLVRRLSVQICAQLGLDDRRQQLIDLCARVRDVGMIGLPDEVVLSSSELSPEQWRLINRHPILGADLLEGMLPLRPAAPVVRAHHERWDGGGYPDGLAGEAIPVLSRVIAAADAFVAIASDRPHRRASAADIAMEHITGESGIQFDPRVVDALRATLHGTHRTPGGPAGRPPATGSSSSSTLRRSSQASPSAGASSGSGHGASRLADALTAWTEVPAFAPAHERAMAAATVGGESLSDLVSAVEASTGLTVAVLRAAQRAAGRHPVANVPDAVAALGASGVADAIAEVPRMAFPWRTPDEALLYHLRVHCQTVGRAAQRIAEEVGFPQRDELIAAALLHDVGKLVMARVRGGLAQPLDERRVTPERRVEAEREEMTVDHASLGALLIERWGLPASLSWAVRSHHSSEAGDRMATLLRLADLVAHHSDGHVVDRRVMLRLTHAVGLPVPALRHVLFDLPHAGSQRRRAEPSPLSRRETDALRQLASGKVYKEIAVALGVSASTVRSHLHSTYAKLGVEDRAQAVLRATEMGWI